MLNETENEIFSGLEVAIIGMAGRFPGANNVNEFWENLKNGKESISFLSNQELLNAGVEANLIDSTNYVKAGGFIEDKMRFDSVFFGYSAREASLMEPQMRIFHECVWSAFEDAGYVPDSYPGKIGFYGGASSSFNWEVLAILSGKSQSLGDLAATTYMNKDQLNTRISYNLNLTGPSIAINTACSTSLVAVHMACQGIMNGDCDMALAGGCSINNIREKGYICQEKGVLSPDGHCRAFDSDANGIIISEGVGVVLLKELDEAVQDRDNIYAVIKSSAINNDGRDKIGYTAPGARGQMAVIKEALQAAKIDPQTISYIETHGTGTSIGDPIELEALKSVFGIDKKKTCGLGSVKTNIGHLVDAAGVASIIKTSLALKYQVIPPNLHFNTLNSKVNLENSPFYVVNELSPWQDENKPRRAGISSFGIGGTNAHVILEEAPKILTNEFFKNKQKCLPHLFLFSAKSQTSLHCVVKNFATYFKQNPNINLGDVAFTLQAGRKSFPFRRFVVGRSVNEVLDEISNSKKPKKSNFYSLDDEPLVFFMFPGGGAQYINMGIDLYQEEKVFQDEMNRCFNILKLILKYDVKEILYPLYKSKSSLSYCPTLETAEVTLSILLAFEYSLAKMLMAWGIKPDAMIGHSLGEYTAACLAGVISIEDALKLVVSRAQLMEKTPKGAMLSVALSEEQLKKIIIDFGNQNICIGAINSTYRCVISGPIDDIKVFEKHLRKKGYGFQRLNISRASHSMLMEPILNEFEQVLEKINLSEPRIRYISNVSGKWVTGADATDSSYWIKHLRGTVRFADGITELIKTGNSNFILVEVGPGDALSNFARKHKDYKKNQFQRILNIIRRPQQDISDYHFLVEQIGIFWLLGKSIDWGFFNSNKKMRRVPLPTYPFEGNCFSIDENILKGNLESKIADFSPEVSSDVRNIEAGDNLSAVHKSEIDTEYIPPRNELEKTLVQIWQEFFEVKSIGIYDDFFHLGGDSLLAIKMVDNINKILKLELTSHILLKKSNIASLAEWISTGKVLNQSLLVEMQEGRKGRAPIFLIHPLGGDVYIYRDLVELMKTDQSIFGILASEKTNGKESLPSIQEIAAIYLKEILGRQSKGPYLLGGASFGGIVAFEMAQQLYAQQKEVKLLFMIDSPGAGSFLRVSKGETEELTQFLSELDSNLPVSEEHLRKLNFPSLEELISRNMVKGTSGKPADVKKEIQIYLGVLNNHIKILKEYNPKIFPGSLIYFRATLPLPNISFQNSHNEWKNLVLKNYKIYDVPGDHFNMNKSPNVSVIANVLNEFIN